MDACLFFLGSLSGWVEFPIINSGVRIADWKFIPPLFPALVIDQMRLGIYFGQREQTTSPVFKTAQNTTKEPAKFVKAPHLDKSTISTMSTSSEC